MFKKKEVLCNNFLNMLIPKEVPNNPKKDSIVENGELVEILSEDKLLKIILGFEWTEKKEVLKETILTTQWEFNNKFYIVEPGTRLILEKDGKISEIVLDKLWVIGESTLLAYLNWEKIPANATVKIMGKYYEIGFDKLKENFEKLSDKKKEAILAYLKWLKEARKGRTKPVFK